MGASANRTIPGDIVQYLENIRPLLDVDGNGQVSAITDGLLLVRYLFGFRESALTIDATGTGATRSTSQIQTHVQSLMP